VVSGDGGVSWSVPAMTLTGDLGPGVTPGTDRHIIWDAAADIPGVVGTYRARVFADDGSTLSNMVLMLGGPFPYQRDIAQQTFVGTLLIDKYEVTNQRYAEFLNSADPDGTYWNASTEITRSGAPPNVYHAVHPGRQNYPVRYVSAIDAEAYAAWLSAREGRTYRLPTEQEWEKAAAWDPTLSKYWAYGFQSDSVTCADANFYPYPVPCVGAPTEVGHYNGTNGTNNARSFYGCYDMTGNVWEWTSANFASECGAGRISRGAAFNTDSSFCQTNKRCISSCYDCYGYDAGSRVGEVGFRLVLEPN
jgi:formylglycine-generating enzyme required for sulfatase activity